MSTGSWDEYGAPITSRIAFAQHLCATLGLGHYSARDDGPIFVLAWIQKEGSPPARNNPLNTTMRATGSTPLPGNSAGVQQYLDLADALNNYAHNLTTNKSYAKLLDALRHGSLSDMASALQRSPWCGGSAGCPGYGADILGIALGYKGSDTKFKTAALKPAGTKFQGHVTDDIGGAGSDSGILGLDPAQGVGDTARNAVTSAADVIAALGGIAAWLTDAHNWTRIGMVAGGIALVLVGVSVIKHDTLSAAAGAIAKGAVLA